MRTRSGKRSAPFDLIYAVRISRLPDSLWSIDAGTGYVGARHREGACSGIQPARTAMFLVVSMTTACLFAQSPPASSDRPWHSLEERRIGDQAPRFQSPTLRIDSEKIYSLAELIDLGEANNPETRVAWESARAQAATLGIARSELFPALATIATAGISRQEVGLGSQFDRQTIPDFQIALELTYTIFDSGARRGRINEESARLLASNFEFNDVHRQLIYNVSEAYYRLLNAAGQEEAAGANLVNAQAVQQAAEERLRNGLATLPDVLEARSATAQAQYNLQAVLGAEEIARGDLLTAVGASASTHIRVQPLDEVATPESIPGSAEEATRRALERRPDLEAQVANVRAAQAERQQAKAAFYPNVTLSVGPSVQSFYLFQQTLPSGHTTDLTGSAMVSLNWRVFDGSARRNQLAHAEARIRDAEARVAAARDQIEDQVWAAYSNLKTAFRQRESSNALLDAATQSYSAALESYNYGVRNLLDVTNAQRVLAEARSTDVLARTQVLAALAELTFRTGDAIHANGRRNLP